MAGDRGHPYDRLVAPGLAGGRRRGAYIVVDRGRWPAGWCVAVHLGSMTAAVAVDVGAALLLVIGAAATGALTPDRGGRT